MRFTTIAAARCTGQFRSTEASVIRIARFHQLRLAHFNRPRGSTSCADFNGLLRANETEGHLHMSDDKVGKNLKGMDELDFVGWNRADWLGTFAHYHTD